MSAPDEGLVPPTTGAGPVREPLTTDGRDLDPALAITTGAAGDQRARPVADGPDHPMPGAGQPIWNGADGPPPGEPSTYHDQPIVKAPPWGPAIPAYLVLGGISGGAALFAAAVGPHASGRLHLAATGLATVAGGTGSVLLLSDLGRPTRMLNMYRVFRPTSPMSVGVYVLSAGVGLSGAAMLFGRQPGWLGVLGRLAGLGAGVAGIPLGGYTGVLLGTTALPGWKVGLRTLPPLFLASGVATAGSILTPLGSGRMAVALDAYRLAGQVVELAMEHAHEDAVDTVPGLDAVYARQRGWRVGKWLTVASIVAGLTPVLRRTTLGRIMVAALGVAGAVATKTAVFEAGMDSAADPRLTTTRSRPSTTP